MQNKKMKMKSLLLGALATALLASCSDDKVTGMSSLANGGEITYSAVANKATRATDLYNNGNLPTSFYVWAALEGNTPSVYISGDEVKDDGTGVYTDVNGTHYWPSGSLDFYATNLADASLDVTSTPTIAYTVAVSTTATDGTTVADQLDLLYAVELGQEKTTNGGVVALNFRHALSQIVFKAENDDANLYVEITGVGVNNVAGTGTFTFPTVATTTNVPDSVGPYPTDNSVGTWSNYSDAAGATENFTDAYSIALGSNVALAGSAESTATTLTSGETALLLLPQEIAVGETHNDAAYLTLECAIYNVAGTTYDPSTDYQIFGTGGASATVYFPVAINWLPGMKYTYNFVFGGTSSGGDGYGEDENDQPILVPITYTVTADEFVEAIVINEDVIASSSTDPEPVDLNLPSGLKWATCNVGATVPADYGDYFAWGEIAPKDEYTTDNSIWYKKSNASDISGNSEYDAATANWGESWRMPTELEINELKEYCTVTEATKINSAGEEVNGFTVTGTNGNSVFFPASGYINGTTPETLVSCYGWTSIPNTTNASYAYRFSISNDGIKYTSTGYRYWGQIVRPVLAEK